MIVFKRAQLEHHKYSHIECDVPGCGEASPAMDDLRISSLFERGWYIAGGKHRCPMHYHDDMPCRGPTEREEDGSEGFVR